MIFSIQLIILNKISCQRHFNKIEAIAPKAEVILGAIAESFRHVYEIAFTEA